MATRRQPQCSRNDRQHTECQHREWPVRLVALIGGDVLAPARGSDVLLCATEVLEAVVQGALCKKRADAPEIMRKHATKGRDAQYVLVFDLQRIKEPARSSRSQLKCAVTRN